MKHVYPPLVDIDPTISLAHVADWERRYEKPFSHDVIKQAHIARSHYQAELIGRLVRSVFALIRSWSKSGISSRVARSQVRQA
jgi:hypothetical protein